MPRIINSYNTGDNSLAKVIASLGNSLFGDTLTPAVNRQKLQSAQREEYGIDQLAQQMGAGGVLDANKSAEMAVLGGMKPDDLSMYQTYLAGNLFGPRDSRTTNAMAGAGKYQQSADAFDIGENNKISMNDADNATSRSNNEATIANAYRMNTDDNATSVTNNTADNNRLWDQFLQEPKPVMGANGQPAYAPQGDLAKPGSGYSPMPTNDLQVDPIKLVQRYITQADALGIKEPEKQRQYALAQVSKAMKKGTTVYGDNGQPLVEIGGDVDPNGSVGPLTNANETQVQRDILSGQQFDTLLDETAKTVAANPNSVGPIGNVRSAVQSARIAAQGFAQMVGAPSIDDAAAQVQAEAIAMGVKPETFNFAYDPSLSEIETLYKMLAFQGIRTIGGQSGNDASDRDFKNIMAILGDPNSWMTNAQDLTSKMKVVKKYVKSRTAANRAALNLPPLPEASPPSATEQQPGAQPPAPGAKQAPDGNWYVPDPARPGKYLQVQP